MKTSEQKSTIQQFKSNTTMSDASILFDHNENYIEDDGYNRNNNNNDKISPVKRSNQFRSKRSEINLHHISPIKSTYSDVENPIHFSHSTPNHHLSNSPANKMRRSPGIESSITDDNIVLPIFKQQTRTKFEIPINYEKRETDTNNNNNNNNNNKTKPEANMKQKLIRELAANILELNKLQSHSEKLNNQLKVTKNENISSQIQSDLDRLKSEMMDKIDVIHKLEIQLNKIEGNSKSNLNKNTPMQGNSHIMNEIRSTLKEMINSQNNTLNKASSVNNIDTASLTVNEMLEELQKAATWTATSLLSTIVKPQGKLSVSPDLNSGASSLSSTAVNKIDIFRAQLEEQNAVLKEKLNKLEDKLKNFETSNVNIHEVEQLKSLILETQKRSEEDKLRLIREFENERHLASNSNIAMMKRFKEELESKINDKNDEMKKYLQTIYTLLPRNNENQANVYNNNRNNVNNFEVYEEQITTNRFREANGDSSFLTEEEETIARISERIQVLKTKIDLKDNKSSSKKSNRNRRNSDESDDTDTKELMHLNEQIRQLKSRMIKKSDQLHRIKNNFQTNGIPNNKNNLQSIMKHDKIYIPIQHLNNRYSSEDNLHLIEPVVQNSYAPVRSELVLNNPVLKQHEFNLQPQFAGNFQRQDNNSVFGSNSSESSSDDDNDEDHPRSKLVVINRSNNRDLSCSPERRYTSSIEIPAEQLEDFKASATKPKPLRRTKSASHTSTAIINSNLKKHSAKISTNPNANLISVCLRSLKTPELETHTPIDQDHLASNLKEAQKEIEQLKNIIEEKNTLINGQRMSGFDKEAHDKEMLYLLQLLENQSKKIIGLKNKIKDLRENGNWNSDTMSSLSDSLDRVRIDLRDNLKSASGSDIEKNFRKLKPKHESRPRKSKVSYKDELLIDNQHEEQKHHEIPKRQNIKLVSELGVQTDDNSIFENLPPQQQQPQEQIFIEQPIEPKVVPNQIITDQFYTPEPQYQMPLDALVCNIPEHHDLEDLVHQSKEQIGNLQSLLKQTQDELIQGQLNARYDVDIMEKRAEFDALDLAINNRKRLLYDLELRKRHELNSSTYSYLNNRYVPISEDGVRYLRDEIECLENTLTKRIHECREIDKNLHEKRQELMIVKESKKKTEKDINSLTKLRKMLNAQTLLFDKKADEATKQLILASDDLEVTKHRKKSLEEDLNKIKSELTSFLDLIKGNSGKGFFDGNRGINSAILEKLFFMQSNNDVKFIKENMSLISNKHKEAQIIEQSIAKQNIELDEINRIVSKQKATLQSLDNEILSKKSEIDILRDRGLAYTKEFKIEIEHYEEEIIKLKRQRDDLNNELRKIKQGNDELAIEIKLKNDALEQKLADIQQSDKNLQQLEILKTNELNQLNDIEKLIQEKRNIMGKMESDLLKFNRDVEQSKSEEANLKGNIEQLRKSLNDNNLALTELSENIEENKMIIHKLNAEKLEYEVKLNNLNHNCNKLNEEYKLREEQLNELSDLNREKENMIKKQEEEIAVLEHEKVNLVQETQQMKEKLRKKKIDLEKFDQANKNMDARLTETQNELRKTMEKLKHSKQELDALQDSMQEVKNKIEELNNERDSNEKILNDISEQLKTKQNEAENLNNFLINTQKQLEHEQKQLNAVQVENAFEKKTYDTYKLRNKDLTMKIKENEYTSSRFQDLEYRLEDKEKFIEQLKIKIAERNSEAKYLKESLSRAQNELTILRREFEDLEETFKEREALLENNLKNVMSRLEANQNQVEVIKEDYEKKIKTLEEGIRDKEKIIKSFTSFNSFDSSQMINSSIISYDSKRNISPLTKIPTPFKDFDQQSSVSSNLLLNKIEFNDIQPKLNSSQHITEEQRKLKEKLQNTISQKANALEKSKIQTKENLDNLKSKLHDIEVMSSNVSFQSNS